MDGQFFNIFKGSKCTIKWESMCLFMSFASVHNIRGLTESMQMLIPAVILMLYNEMGLEIDSTRLSKVCPSNTMLINCEERFPCECYMATLARDKRSKARCR